MGGCQGEGATPATGVEGRVSLRGGWCVSGGSGVGRVGGGNLGGVKGCDGGRRGGGGGVPLFFFSWIQEGKSNLVRA